MGMYTEFHFNAQLRTDTPRSVIDTLMYMLDSRESPPLSFPDHALFQCDRWNGMLLMGSSYFPMDPSSSLKRFSEIGRWNLSIRTNLKNYNAEIEKFIHWIMPYVDMNKGEFLGFWRYEESLEPELIFST